MNVRGFTLLEVLVTSAILIVVGVLGFVAVLSATSSVSLAQAKAEAQDCVREALDAMTREVELAARPRGSEEPPLPAGVSGLEVLSGSEVGVEFQVPLDAAGANWSNTIRYQFFDEDQNDNCLLDSGEDEDGDGLLTRRVVRMEDADGDGSFDGAGETRPIGGANAVSDCQFALNQGMLTITLTADVRIPGTAHYEGGDTRHHTVPLTMASRVFLLN